MRYDPVLGCLLGVPASLAATTCLSQPQEIGKAITVVPAVESDVAGAVYHLEPGAQIFRDGVVRTYKVGAAGLRFLDQTTLTVYPNSSVKLDRFVYNPDRTIAEVALSLLKGAFRLASGGAHTSEKYSLTTPHVTLGIRGTIVHVVADELSTVVQALHGAFEGCSKVSGICKLVQASDPLNGARFWKDGRVELGRFPHDLGVRRAGGAGSVGPTTGALEISARVDAPPIDGATPRVAAPPRAVPILPELPLVSASPASPPRDTSAICFVRGTLIATPTGERRIEDLQAGDEVVTQSSGSQRVRWILKQIFTRPPGTRWGRDVAPICIEKDAIGDGYPARRLILSPNHAILLDDTLIPARLLVNGRSIRQIDYSGSVLEYFNIELDSHEIIFANGIAAETYCPVDERAREHWSNFFEYSRAYPGEEHRRFEPMTPALGGGRRTLLEARARSVLAPLVGRRGILEKVRHRIIQRARSALT